MDKKPDNREEVKYIASSLRKLSELGELFEKGLSSLVVTDDVLMAVLTETSERLDRLEYALLELSKPDDQNPLTSELRTEIYKARVESLKRQLLKQNKNKNALEEESANYAGYPPIELRNRINEIVEDMHRIEEEIEYFRRLLNE